MPEFVYDIPFRQLAIYFAIIAVGAMLLGILIVKPLLRLLLGSDPRLNESIGSAAAGFNLFYDPRLGLLTVAAYQNSERVREGILNEATTIGALNSDMSTYPEPIRSDTRYMLPNYVLFTIHKDWGAPP